MRRAYRWRTRSPLVEQIARTPRSRKSAIRKIRKVIPSLLTTLGNRRRRACESWWMRYCKAILLSSKHRLSISSSDARGSPCRSWRTCWNTRANHWTLPSGYRWIFCNITLHNADLYLWHVAKNASIRKEKENTKLIAELIFSFFFIRNRSFRLSVSDYANCCQIQCL